MICQRIGRPPISIIGLGRTAVSSERRLPIPPARMTAFMFHLSVQKPSQPGLSVQNRFASRRTERSDRELGYRILPFAPNGAIDVLLWGVSGRLIALILGSFFNFSLVRMGGTDIVNKTWSYLSFWPPPRAI